MSVLCHGGWTGCLNSRAARGWAAGRGAAGRSVGRGQDGRVEQLLHGCGADILPAGAGDVGVAHPVAVLVVRVTSYLRVTGLGVGVVLLEAVPAAADRRCR